MVAAPLPQRLRPGFLETWKFCLFLERRGGKRRTFFLTSAKRKNNEEEGRIDGVVEELFVEI